MVQPTTHERAVSQLSYILYVNCTQIKRPESKTSQTLSVLWTLLGSNQRPPDYESGALTV